MKVVFLENAEQELVAIYRYIAVENNAPDSAEKLVSELEEKTVNLLSHSPEIGRRIDDEFNIRFIVVRNYSIVYKVENDRVSVMNIYRAGRNWR